MLKKAFEQFGFTARAYTRILKVARTIADLDSSDKIQEIHLIGLIDIFMHIEMKVICIERMV